MIVVERGHVTLDQHPDHVSRGRGERGQHRERLAEDRDRMPSIGIRQRRACQPTDAEMVMMMRVGVPGRLEAAQAADAAELGEDQRDPMVSVLERLVVGVPVVAFHDRRKLPPAHRFEKVRKDAIAVAHARPFLSLDNQKRSVCAGPAGACTATQ
jgi:hypothetical protein